jgi:hypothetical protein
MTKYVYLIDHWSLNGLIVLIAENDMRAFSLVITDPEIKFKDENTDAVMNEITNATKLMLSDDYECGIISAMVIE